ncbi:MAG: cadherin domain-containing protein [Devosia sp.]
MAEDFAQDIRLALAERDSNAQERAGAAARAPHSANRVDPNQTNASASGVAAVASGMSLFFAFDKSSASEISSARTTQIAGARSGNAGHDGAATPLADAAGIRPPVDLGSGTPNADLMAANGGVALPDVAAARSPLDDRTVASQPGAMSGTVEADLMPEPPQPSQPGVSVSAPQLSTGSSSPSPEPVVVTQTAGSDEGAAIAAPKNLHGISAIADLDGAAAAVDESAGLGSRVGITAHATDGDAADTVVYALANDAGGLFAIDPATGEVTLAGALDFETHSSFTIDVTATSSDGSLATRSYVIAINDVNEVAVSAISDNNSASNSVDENAAIGTSVGITALATDSDGTATVSYSLSNNAGGLFAIDANTGEVTVAGALDRETAASYSIEVTATSSDGSTSTQNYAIALNDLNEFAVSPVSDSDTGANTLAENAAAGTAVGVVAQASDADATNSAITYSVDDARFSVDADGTVRVAAGASFDFETEASIDIAVTATSVDGSTSSQTFTLAVSDFNEAAVSAISDANAAANAVDENSAIGTSVGITAFASDADGTATVSYSLSDNAGGLFAIDANTGEVTVAGALNRETAASYQIEVTATSSDGSTSVQSYNIALNDLNEFAVSPVSDSDTGANTLAENAAAGTAVGVVAQASDADATNSAITYSVDDARFSVDADGTVRVAAGASFDFETEASIDIAVTATSADGSTSSQSFTLDVANVIDETPTDITYTGGAVHESVSSGGSIGSAYNAASAVVAVLSTVDADGSTDSFTYVITNDASGHFEIVGNEIRVKAGEVIDYETASAHDLTVEVTDAAGNHYAETITVNVIDYEGSYSASSSQAMTGTSEEDVLTGSAGNDTFTGGAGNDVIDGGSQTPGVSIKAMGYTMTNPESHITTPDGVQHNATRGYLVIVMDADGTVVSQGMFDTYASPANATALANFLDAIPNGSYVAIASFDDPNTNVANNPTLVAAFERVGVDGATIENIGYRSAYSYYGQIDDSGVATEIDSGYQPASGTAVLLDIDGSGDTAIYSGNLADYIVTEVSPGVFEVVDNRPGSPDGTDTLTNIEHLQFADQSATPHDAAIGNSAPTDITFTGGSVNETVTSGGTIGSAYNPSGATVAVLSTNDGDAGDSHTYSIINDASGKFEIVGNEVRVKAGQTIDYETAQSRDITVQVTDGAGATYFETITIQVVDYEGHYTAGNGGETVVGTSEENTLTGGTGNDDIKGGAGSDVISAGAGNDTVRLTTGADTIDGGSGTDTLVYTGSSSINVNLATGVVTGSGMTGTTITSIEAVHAGSGSDTLTGSSAADELWGGSGNDTITGGAGNDALRGDDGNDRLIGGTGNDDIQGGNGTDTAVFSGNRSDYSIHFDGTSYTVADLRSGTPDGTDTVRTVENFEFANGTITAANILGSAPTDIHFTPNAGLGNASTTLAAGSVLFSVASVTDADSGDHFSYSLSNNPYGAFAIDSATGAVSLTYSQNPVNSTSSITVRATDSSGNTYDEVVNLYSGDGTDSTLSGSGTGFYVGAGGNDTITAGAGDDMIFAGTGNDTVSAGAGNDSVYLGDGNDIFDTAGGTMDDDGDDYIDGGAGADSIWAGGGDDILVGGTGNDLLEGEAGNDTFIYAAGDGSDTVHGGAGWTDTIQLQGMDGGITINDHTITGHGWTMQLDAGSSIVAQNGEELTLSTDAHGTITFTDGAVMTFADVEKVAW